MCAGELRTEAGRPCIGRLRRCPACTLPCIWALPGTAWQAGLLPGPASLDERGRINRLIIDHDFKMQVASGGVSGCSDAGDPRARGQNLSDGDSNGLQMVVSGLQTVAVIDNNPVSAAILAPTSLDHGPGTGSEDRSRARTGEINSRMHFTGRPREGVHPVSKRRADIYRGQRGDQRGGPNRRSALRDRLVPCRANLRRLSLDRLSLGREGLGRLGFWCRRLFGCRQGADLGAAECDAGARVCGDARLRRPCCGRRRLVRCLDLAPISLRGGQCGQCNQPGSGRCSAKLLAAESQGRSGTDCGAPAAFT